MVASDDTLVSPSPATPASVGASAPTPTGACRSAFVACLGLACLLPAYLVSALAAAEKDKPAPLLLDATPALRDLEATIRAREALGKDPELAPLNLGVKVRRGEATLWGSIPSEGLIRRATQRLENVRGVYKVHSELVVVAPPSGPIVLPLPESPTRTQSASPGRAASQLNVPPDHTTEVPGAHVTLRRPVAAADPSPSFETSPASNSKPLPSESLEKAVERLRQTDLRFVSIKTEIRGSTVLVHGAKVRGEYVTKFAQEISRLPGVERVEVDSRR